MVIQGRNSWRLRFGRTPPIHGRGSRLRNMHFIRYKDGGVEWRYWRFALGAFYIAVERPHSERDMKKLAARLKRYK